MQTFPDKTCTLSRYRALPEAVRLELIDGVAHRGAGSLRGTSCVRGS